MVLVPRPPAFDLRTLSESGREEETGSIEKQSKTRGGGEGAEGEDTKWAEKGYEKVKGGAGVLH